MLYRSKQDDFLFTWNTKLALVTLLGKSRIMIKPVHYLYFILFNNYHWIFLICLQPLALFLLFLWTNLNFIAIFEAARSSDMLSGSDCFSAVACSKILYQNQLYENIMICLEKMVEPSTQRARTLSNTWTQSCINLSGDRYYGRGFMERRRCR